MLVVTADVATVNCALVLPDGTTILAGTGAEALELVRLTVAPAAGAAADKVTVAVVLAPPMTLILLRLKLDTD